MKNIIVPIDYSDASINAANYAAALAKTFGARIILFHSFPLYVPSPGMPFLFPDLDEEIIEHKASLNSLGEELSRFAGLPLFWMN
ncbi:MAG: universal stress protein [Bacteroidota bacterium]|jgi:nucleotide-binding universal stress UspA family protein|nr:universal stress protein [Bacteroidota bacterium]